MEDGSFSMADLRKFWITKEDFDKAIQQFVDTRKGSDRRAIGFGK
jgi:hypothetical protein